MNCPKCNKPIALDTRFCGGCGERIAPVTSAAIAAASGSTAAPDLSAKGSRVDPSSLFQRMKNIVLSPKSEWPVIASESTSTGQLFTSYAVPLTAFLALMSFVRMSIIGVNIPFAGSIRTPLVTGIVYALCSFAFGLVGLYLVGLIVNAWAPTFAGIRDQRQALKVAAYSLTPAWLSSVFALSPVLGTLLQLLAGLYGIYVLSVGLPFVMRSPRERAFGYTAAVVLSTILLGAALGTVGTALGLFGHSAGLFSGSAVAQQSSQEAARDQGAAVVGNVIGNVLGTDDKGKAGLSAALSNLAKAGDQSPQTPARDSSGGGAGDASPGADAAQNALGAAGGLLTALGGALRGDHSTSTVDFKALKDVLPASLAGMTRTSTAGENNQAIGVKTATAKADYHSDSGTIHLEISDMSGVSGLMGLANGLIQNSESESNAGYEKNTVVGGRSVHEKYDASSHQSEITVMLSKRYQVDLTGEHVEMSVLERALGQIDLGRLESMKNAGSGGS